MSADETDFRKRIEQLEALAARCELPATKELIAYEIAWLTEHRTEVASSDEDKFEISPLGWAGPSPSVPPWTGPGRTPSGRPSGLNPPFGTPPPQSSAALLETISDEIARKEARLKGLGPIERRQEEADIAGLQRWKDQLTSLMNHGQGW